MAPLPEAKPAFPPPHEAPFSHAEPQQQQQEEQQEKGGCRARRRRRRRERAEGEEAKKRKLSEEQVRYLETRFWEERKLESGRKAQLARELGLEPKQVAVWFQNRRARWKSKQLEEEYVHLKLAHEALLLRNCHLEAELLKLEQQLSEARERAEKLSHARDAPVETVNSPSTSTSVETRQPFPGAAFGAIEPLDQLVYIDEYSYVNISDFFYGM